MEDFVSCRDDAGFLFSERVDIEERCRAGRFSGSSHFILLNNQGDNACTSQFIALVDGKAAVTGGNHHVPQGIDGFQSVTPDSQDAVTIGNEFDFPFFRLTAMHVCAHTDIPQDSCRFIFMK